MNTCEWCSVEYELIRAATMFFFAGKCYSQATTLSFIGPCGQVHSLPFAIFYKELNRRVLKLKGYVILKTELQTVKHSLKQLKTAALQTDNSSVYLFSSSNEKEGKKVATQHLVGSFSNDDGGCNKNVKKSMRFITKTTLHFLVNVFAVTV